MFMVFKEKTNLCLIQVVLSIKMTQDYTISIKFHSINEVNRCRHVKLFFVDIYVCRVLRCCHLVYWQMNYSDCYHQHCGMKDLVVICSCVSTTNNEEMIQVKSNTIYLFLIQCLHEWLAPHLILDSHHAHQHFSYYITTCTKCRQRDCSLNVMNFILHKRCSILSCDLPEIVQLMLQILVGH